MSSAQTHARNNYALFVEMFHTDPAALASREKVIKIDYNFKYVDV